MAIYEIRFLDASNSPLLIYVTAGEEVPDVDARFDVADDLPYTRYEIWCGLTRLHESRRTKASNGQEV